MRTLCLFLLAVLAASAHHARADDRGLSLTVYSSADPAGFDPKQFLASQRQDNPAYYGGVPGFGVVRDRLEAELREGVNEIKVTDIAEQIDPTTVSITDVDEQWKTEVLEQLFQFDLVSSAKLLEKYVDKQIEVRVTQGDTVEAVSGKLLSSRGNLVLATDRGVRVLPASGNYTLGELPGGLITRPTLLWRVKTPKAGTRALGFSYQTDGLTWRSDYNLVLSQDDRAAALSAWVTLLNLSGTSYPDAQLKLIAGDVQRIERQALPRSVGAEMSLLAQSDAGGFVEKPFFEYHLYTLPRRVTVPDNSTQQIALFGTVPGVPVEKVLVYFGSAHFAGWQYGGAPFGDRNFGDSGNKKVDVYVRFKNEKQVGLGIPLPKGKMRVFKADTDKSLEFVGEDLIDHTARNEEVLIKLGQSFDVVGERVQTDYFIDSSAKRIRESFKIELRNNKDAPVKVIAREILYRWSNWNISGESVPYEKVNSRTIEFPVEIPANGKQEIRYTANYSW